MDDRAAIPVRSRLRYRVRTMLAVVALLCMLLALVVVPGQRQRQALEKIRGMNPQSRAFYDYEFYGGPEPRGPQWLRRWIGDEHLQYVARAEFLLDGRDDMTLDELANLPGLEQLCIDGAPLVNDQLRSLGRLRKLELLALNSNELSDKGLEQLSHVAALQHLSVKSNQITGERLRPLAALQNLRVIILESSRLSPRGFEALAHLDHVERLYIKSNNLTDDCLESISKMKRVTELRIRGDSEDALSGITDEGFRHLGQLASLRHLVIGSPGLTDAGLTHLATLRNLVQLDVSEGQYTEQGVARLQAELPALTVNYRVWKSEGGKTVIKHLQAAPTNPPGKGATRKNTRN